MSELEKILKEIRIQKNNGNKRLYINDDISYETREELEQRGYMVIVSWSHEHIVYVIGWK